MKKYTLPIILLAVSFSISLSGCQKQEGKSTEENRIEAGNTQTVQSETGVPEESQATEKDLAEPIEAGISEGNLEGKALYSECPFVYGDSEWKLQTFVPEDMLIDGELAMDDRVNFLIQAVCGGESYVLFDEMVQIGVPAADVFIDQQERCILFSGMCVLQNIE